MKRISAELRFTLAARGWYVCSLYQIPQSDGRRLSLCAIPTDPWHVILCDHPNSLEAGQFRSARGATAREAIAAALPPRDDLKAALARLETAVELLTEAYR